MDRVEIFSIRTHAIANKSEEEYKVIRAIPAYCLEHLVQLSAFLLDEMDKYLLSDDNSDDSTLAYLNNTVRLAQVGMMGYHFLLGDDIPFTRIANQMVDTYKRKNADYGDSFSESLDKYGFVAAHVRISDKINRLRSLVVRKQTEQVKDESIADTFLDLACYAIMRFVYIEMKSEIVEEEKEEEECTLSILDC